MVRELKIDREFQVEKKKMESDATNLLYPEMEEEVGDRSGNSQLDITGDDRQEDIMSEDGVSDEEEINAVPFSFLKPHLVE